MAQWEKPGPHHVRNRRRRIIKRYAMNDELGFPLRCDKGSAYPMTKRGKIMYKDRKSAESAAVALEAAELADLQEAYWCEPGHFHLRSVDKRRRMTNSRKRRKLKQERMWREEEDPVGRWYRIHADGRVIAYGRMISDGPRPRLWWAREWTADPRGCANAVCVHVLVSAPWGRLQETLESWSTRRFDAPTQDG